MGKGHAVTLAIAGHLCYNSVTDVERPGSYAMVKWRVRVVRPEVISGELRCAPSVKIQGYGTIGYPAEACVED